MEDNAPATKKDLRVMEDRILTAVTKAISDLGDVIDRQFNFVAEQITKLHDRIDALELRLDKLEATLLDEIRSSAEQYSRIFDHERRITQLERRERVAA